MSPKEEMIMKRLQNLEQEVQSVFDSHADYPNEEFTLNSIIQGVNRVLEAYKKAPVYGFSVKKIDYQLYKYRAWDVHSHETVLSGELPVQSKNKAKKEVKKLIKSLA
jgi:hypothetical protein